MNNNFNNLKTMKGSIFTEIEKKIAKFDATLTRVFKEAYHSDIAAPMIKIRQSLIKSLNYNKIDIQNTNFNNIVRDPSFMGKIKKDGDNGLVIIVGRTNYTYRNYFVEQLPGEDYKEFGKRRDVSEDYLFILAYKTPNSSFYNLKDYDGARYSLNALINSKGESIPLPNRTFDAIAYKNIEKYAYAVYYANEGDLVYKDQDLLDSRKQINTDIYSELEPKDQLAAKTFISQLKDIKQLVESKVKEVETLSTKVIRQAQVEFDNFKIENTKKLTEMLQKTYFYSRDVSFTSTLPSDITSDIQKVISANDKLSNIKGLIASIDKGQKINESRIRDLEGNFTVQKLQSYLSL